MPTLNLTLSIGDLPADEQRRLAGGMRSPKVDTLAAGERIYRFASTFDRSRRAPIPASSWATGAWWLRERDYRKIEEACQQSLATHHGDRTRALPLSFFARQAAAICQDWSNVDALVCARVLTDLSVFSGCGRTQYHEQPRGGTVSYNLTFTWRGWHSVEQIYIPFLDRYREGYASEFQESGHKFKVIEVRKVLEILERRKIDNFELWKPA